MSRARAAPYRRATPRGQPAAEPAVELRAGPRADGHREDGVEGREPGEGLDDVALEGRPAGALRQGAGIGQAVRAGQRRADPLEQGADDEADHEREDAPGETRRRGSGGEEADPGDQGERGG